jgi:predicted ATPase
LPPPLTRFFGRDDQIATLQTTLEDRAMRLITLTGPGGSGKTRLAVETAGQLEDTFGEAIWFVPLADLSDARLIPHTLTRALHLPRSPGAEPLEQAVALCPRIHARFWCWTTTSNLWTRAPCSSESC